MMLFLTAVTIIIPMIFAIVFHEVAHGMVARWLGDPTASERGRLSLNPLRHVDLFGTVLLPGLLFFAHAPVFGWAKPVPVDYSRLRNPKRDMALVVVLEYFLGFNCFLGLFNQLPLPPFDGSRILRGIAPWPMARLLDRIEPFGLIVFALLFVVLPQVFPGLHLLDRFLLPPVGWLISQMELVAGIPFSDFFNA